MNEKLIKDYTLKNPIGEGGMAVVYLAEHNTLNQPVAIKVLNKEFVHNDNIRKRFLSEARNIFKMSHPNIIKVTDLIDEGDTIAFVMEYMDGQTLKDYLDSKGRLSDEEIKKLFIQMLDAVGYVHEQGLIHRDIKPSNFMISSKGVVKLLDFGIAKNTDTTSAEYTQTGTAQSMGTPMYMSPEQIKSTNEVTAKSDIYSLGVVLWQIVMGKKPYDSNTTSSFELQTKIVNDTLSKTSTVWDDLIQKATRKNCNDRFLSCQDFYNSTQNLTKKDLNVDDDKTIINSSTISDKTVIEKVIKKETLLVGAALTGVNVLKYGFINRQGNWIIQPMFDEVSGFDDQGFASAQLNEKYGFINRQGNWIVQPMFDVVSGFDDQGFASAQLNEKYGFINLQGNWIIQPMFNKVFGGFDDQGYACVKLNEKWGFINRQGNWIIQPMFDDIVIFDDQGSAFVKLNEKWGFINRQGNWIIQPMFNKVFGGFDDQGYACVKLNEKWGFINRQGNWIIQPMFDDVFNFDDHGFAGAQLNEKWGFINRQGNWMIQPMFDSASSFGFDKEGFTSAYLNSKWGFIDRQGNWVIQPMYEYVTSFDNQGLACAELNQKWGCINRQGNWVIQPTFDHVTNLFDKFYACVLLNGKWGFINHQGNWIIQPMFDDVESFDDQGLARVKLNEKWGFINRQGNWVIKPAILCEKIDYDTFKVSEDNKYGFKNSKDEWIIQAQFDYVHFSFLGDEMVWSDEKREWEVGDESGDRVLNLEDFDKHFGHLIGKEKVYLGEDIPTNKLANFSKNFPDAESFVFDDYEIFVYYDDTLFGKGDDGFAITNDSTNFYLYVNTSVFGCFSLEDDGEISYITQCSYSNSKGVVISANDQEGNETVYELGLKNEVGKSLILLLNQYYGDGTDF